MKSVSLGKYNSGLYLKGRAQYSTLFGGTATLLFALIGLVYSVIVLMKVGSTFNLEISIYEIDSAFGKKQLENYKISDT